MPPAAPIRGWVSGLVTALTAAAVVLGAAACAGGPETEGAGTANRTEASSGGPGVFLARQVPDPKGFATSLIRGKLVLDDRGCFLVDGAGASLVPVWPFRYEARVEGDEVRVVNGRGRTVARVGERIRAGGGEVSSLNDLGAVEREEAREIQERCPSKTYWLVGGGVRIAHRG